MATNFLYRVIKKTDVAFYPPIDLQPKGHYRRVPLRYNNTVACFCLCSCEVNTALPLEKGKLNTSFMLTQLRGKQLHVDQSSVKLTLD